MTAAYRRHYAGHYAGRYEMHMNSDTTTRTLTLSDIAASANVQKRAAQGWLSKARADHGELGEIVDNTRYFNIEERRILLNYAAPPRSTKSAQNSSRNGQSQTPPEGLGLSLDIGNHCTTVDLPGFEGLTIDLGQFRDSEALIIDDPLAVAEQFLQTADLIQEALASDIANREQRLARTKQAQAKIAAKAQELNLEQRLYRLQTSQIDAAQTDETKAMADALRQLQSLGKPAAEADT